MRKKSNQRTRLEQLALEAAYLRIHEKIQLFDIRQRPIAVRRNGSDVKRQLDDGSRTR